MGRLTKKQKAFADNYLEEGIGTTAAIKSYNLGSKGGKIDEKGIINTASSIATENLKKLDIRKYLEENAGGAITRIEELGRKAKNEAVRLNANKDIADRAGYKPVERQDITSKGEKIYLWGNGENNNIHPA